MKHLAICLLILLTGCATSGIKFELVDGVTHKQLEGVQSSWSANWYSYSMERKECDTRSQLTDSQGVVTVDHLTTKNRINSFRFEIEGYHAAAVVLATWLNEVHVSSPALDINGIDSKPKSMPWTNHMVVVVPMWPWSPGDDRELKVKRKIFQIDQ